MNRPADLRPEDIARWESLIRYGQAALCRFCKRPAFAYANPAETRCDACWEVVRRLEDFLRDGGEAAREVVESALREGK